MKAIRFRQTSNSLTDIHYEPGQAFSFLNIKQDSLSILEQILNISCLAIFKHILRFSITTPHHNQFNIIFSSNTQALYKRKRFPYSQGTSVSSLKLLSTWQDLSCWCRPQHLLLPWTFLLNPPCQRDHLSSWESPWDSPGSGLLKRLARPLHNLCFQGLLSSRVDMRTWRTTRDSYWTPCMSPPSSWRGFTAGWTWSFFLVWKWHGRSLELSGSKNQVQMNLALIPYEFLRV